MNEAEREAAENDMRDRETFRDYYNGSRLGTRDSEREPVRYRGRDNSRMSEEHPFAIAEEDRSFMNDGKSETSESKTKRSDSMEEKRKSPKEESMTVEDVSKDKTDTSAFIRKIFMNPVVLERMHETPISYAGFKPQ